MCPADAGIEKRATPTDDNTTPDLVLRQAGFQPSQPAQMELVAAYIILQFAASATTDLVYKLWDDVVVSKYTHVTVENVQEAFSRRTPAIRNIIDINQEAAADTLTCRMDMWDAFIGEGGLTQKPKCRLEVLYEADPYLARDENDDQDDPLLSGFGEWFDGLQDLDDIAQLESRAGKARNFAADLGTRKFKIRSVSYVNGDNGHNLERATGDTTRYILYIDPNDCSVCELKDDGDDTVEVHGNVHLP